MRIQEFQNWGAFRLRHAIDMHCVDGVYEQVFSPGFGMNFDNGMGMDGRPPIGIVAHLAGALGINIRLRSGHTDIAVHRIQAVEHVLHAFG